MKKIISLIIAAVLTLICVMPAFAESVCELSYDANNSEFKGTVPASVTISDGSEVTVASALTAVGYDFLGWNTKADGTGDSVVPDTKIYLTGDVILFGQWRVNDDPTVPSNNTKDTEEPKQDEPKNEEPKQGEVRKFILSYNLNGAPGAVPAGSTVIADENAAVTMAPRWDEHEFLGWNTKADGTGKTYLPGMLIKVSENITLFALWGENVTITYDVNGGKGLKNTTVSVQKDSEVALIAAPQLSGSKFLNWNTKKDGKGTAYVPGTKVKVTANITLYAQWETVVETVTLTYDINSKTYTGVDAKEIDPVKVEKNKQTFILLSPLSTNYKFKNWNTMADGTGKSYEFTDTITLTEDTTLYAQWEKKAATDKTDDNKKPTEKIQMPDTGSTVIISISAFVALAIAAVVAVVCTKKKK